MGLLDLNLESISCICEYLNVYDLTRLSCSCSSLRMLYPDVEIKQRERMQHVINDINSIIYAETCRWIYGGSSSREFRDVKTKYSYYISITNNYLQGNKDEARLYVEYSFISEKKRVGDVLQDEHSDMNKYLRFKTRIDNNMWYVDDEEDDDDDSIMLTRKRFRGGISISVNTEVNGKQNLFISDGAIGEGDPALKFMPPWADKLLD